MRFKFFIGLMALIPISAYCQSEAMIKLIPHISNPKSNTIIEKHYSNESDFTWLKEKGQRTIDVPTHIIRTQGFFNNLELGCDEVLKFLNEKVFDPIVFNKFTYNIYTTCGYDKETNYATRISIESYFDPLTDKAVVFLENYLAQVNGLDIFGIPLVIESAKGMVVANNIMAGVMKKPNTPPFIVYRQDRSNFAFKSNYEMAVVMLTDVYENFYSDEPSKILPFIDRWVYPGFGMTYHRVLSDSNYVELQPERIFLMEKEGDIFVSNFRYYFGHLCHKHENHHCLKR